MRRARRAIYSLLLSVCTLFAFLAGSSAIAGSQASGTSSCRPVAVLPMACLSVLRIDPPTIMQHDTDSIDILPGERTFLEPNFPNPFSVATTIAYSIAEQTRVELRVYDFDFVEVALLVDEDQQPGRYRVLFDPFMLPLRAPSGMYFFELRTSRGIEQRRMLYTK